MKLGIDAREIQNGGYSVVGRPLTDFLKFFASQQNDDRCILFSSDHIPINFGPRIKNIILKKRSAFFWDNESLPKAVLDEKIDVFYSPNYKIPLKQHCLTISTISDMMPLAFKPYRDSASIFFKAYYMTLGKTFAQRSDKILTCSEHSKNDIIDIYSVPHEKINVIPLSVDETYKAENNFFIVDAARRFWGIKGPYLLYSGNFTLHENVGCIVEAFNCLALKYPDLQLVLAGPKKNDYEALVSRIHELELTNRVIFPGEISPADKPHVLYSGAEVFVVPTLYEGFAHAHLKAMACGVPIVSANTTAIPELVRDAGLLVDPLDVADVVKAIEAIMTNTDLRKKLITRGLEYVKQYETEKISRRMYEFFAEQYKVSLARV